MKVMTVQKNVLSLRDVDPKNRSDKILANGTSFEMISSTSDRGLHQVDITFSTLTHEALIVFIIVLSAKFLILIFCDFETLIALETALIFAPRQPNEMTTNLRPEF